MPYKDLDARRAYDRARNRTAKRRRVIRDSADLRPFVGVDGEGGYVKKDGRQEYLLLRAGDSYITSDTGLSPDACLRFLADLPPDHIYVAYSFNYDVTMMVRDLPWHKVRQLVRRDTRISKKTGRAFMVDIRWIEGNSRVVGDIQIDWIPEKEFSVRKWLGTEWSKTVIIHDIWTFFQQRFTSALRDWLPDAEYADVITRMEATKGERDAFGQMTEHEIAYNADECRMMALMMSRFRATLEECGIPFPAKWQGPGNIASSMFNKHGIPKRATRSDPVAGKHLTIAQDYPHVVLAANNAYYGGRFEPLMIGQIPGPIYQYDINSAYAAMYAKLPCLIHGKWRKHSRGVPSAPWYIGHVKYRTDFSYGNGAQPMGPFPCRTRNGTIVYPLSGEGWYTSPEIETAGNNGFHVEFVTGYVYRSECDCAPFDFVAGLYRQRKEAGKSNRGRIFKLALASMYGKLAQSVGEPVYSNPIWASFITGYVRAQLFHAAMSVNNGNDVVMLATDGIFTRVPLPHLPLGPKLGEWELTVHPEMLVVQSGVYLAGAEKPKTRGVPMEKVREQGDTLWWYWRNYITDAYRNIDPALHDRDTVVPDGSVPSHITVDRRVFTGLRMAVHLDRPSVAGTWDTVTRDVNYMWETKRVTADIAPDGVQHTYPPSAYTENGNSVASHYYTKDIGKMSGNAAMHALRMMESEQPDWNI